MPTSLWVTLAAATTAFLVFLVVAASVVWGIRTYGEAFLTPSKKPARSPKETLLEALAARVAGLEVKVEALPSLWAEERERAKKHADRAGQAVRDLDARMAPSEDESDAYPELPSDDEVIGGPELVLPLREDVGEPDDSLTARAAQAIAIFGRR